MDDSKVSGVENVNAGKIAGQGDAGFGGDGVMAVDVAGLGARVEPWAYDKFFPDAMVAGGHSAQLAAGEQVSPVKNKPSGGAEFNRLGRFGLPC